MSLVVASCSNLKALILYRRIVSPIVPEQLEKEIGTSEETNVNKFCLDNNISTIAKGLSSTISVANAKISQNIRDKLLSLICLFV